MFVLGETKLGALDLVGRGAFFSILPSFGFVGIILGFALVEVVGSLLSLPLDLLVVVSFLDVPAFILAAVSSDLSFTSGLDFDS